MMIASDTANDAPAADLPANGFSLRLAVSVEAVIVIALAALALVLRLAELDTFPLNAAESREALAAWHFAYSAAPGDAPLATSPLLFALNSLLMMGFGGMDLTARLATALGGVALALLPLLWRREIGHVPALLASALLVFSPAALTASRIASGLKSEVLAVPLRCPK